MSPTTQHALASLLLAALYVSNMIRAQLQAIRLERRRRVMADLQRGIDRLEQLAKRRGEAWRK
ncbi:hypothetical protein ACXR0O_19135 [Verrucomicrobiota bacterium sgz303538]